MGTDEGISSGYHPRIPGHPWSMPGIIFGSVRFAALPIPSKRIHCVPYLSAIPVCRLVMPSNIELTEPPSPAVKQLPAPAGSPLDHRLPLPEVLAEERLARSLANSFTTSSSASLLWRIC